MSIQKEIKVLQWNCHSLRSKLSNFKLHLYTTRPHIVCLTETWLASSFEPCFINYTAIYKHRDANHAGGGLAILVRSDVPFTSLAINPFNQGKLEILGLTVFLQGNKPMSVLNIYNPNETVTHQEFTHYFDQLAPSCIIVGDFNAHNPLWEPGKIANATGRNLFESVLVKPSIALLTPPSLPTYFNIYHNSFSTLDLTFIAADLVPLSTVYTEEDMGSDHYPVVTCIGIEASTVRYRTRPSWMFGDGSWAAWSAALTQQGTHPDNNIEASNHNIIQAINSASSQSFPKTKELITPRFNKPWWNQACADAVEAKRATKRALIAIPSQANLINFKRCEAVVKREVKLAKKASWTKYCSSITSDTPISKIWSKIKRLQTPFKRKTQPFILPDSSIISGSPSKAYALASHYEEVLSSPVPSPYPRFVTLPLAIALNEEDNSPLNAPFQLHEMDSCILSLRSTSPGSDQVHNQHLVHLPLDFRIWLIGIFTQSLETGVVPQIWKEAVIIPIPKPGKPLMCTSFYSPISLLSCIVKLMESMINKRLTYFLEQKQALRPSQGGFRCRMSAIDQVARLEAAIHRALHTKSALLACFIDLSSAFDRVWHTGLLYKLSCCGVQGSLLRWFHAYLSERTFKVFFEGEYSSSRPIKSGVPQGAILSPTLFNVMMSDMLSTHGVSVAEYADDITFFVSHPNIQVATNLLQAQIDSFVDWTFRWGLKLNLGKTKIMCFTTKKVHALPIQASGHNLEYVQQHRYLGVVLDAPCLRWRPHIEMLKTSCLPVLNLLKSISHRHWGADRQTLIKLYKVLLCSKLDYASPFYASAAQSHLSKLNVLQNSSLRIATGCRKTTPITTLEIETNIPSLKIHRDQLMCRYYSRLRQLPECPATNELILARHSCPENVHCSFVPHTRAIFSSIGLPCPRFIASPLISPLPQWFNVNNNIFTNFNSIPKSSLSPAAITQMFHDLSQNKYASCVAAYTDGSRVEEPTCSTSAAVVVPSRGVSLNWKLRPEVQVLESELFAIQEALTWAQNNLLLNEKFVIFTDSQSSLFLIKDRKPEHYLPLVFKIQAKLLLLNSSHATMLQFIPSHCGILGNEAADLAAREAHILPYHTLTTPSKEELARSIDDAISVSWCTSWHQEMRRSGKGLFIAQVKDKLGTWPWASHPSRAIETAVACLRTGHAGVRSHLARFGLAPNPLCPCGTVETIYHLIFECRNHSVARTQMLHKLAVLNVTPNLKNLLGGGPFPLPTQSAIVEALASFLYSSHVINSI